MTFRRRASTGFTLVEVMIVTGIFASMFLMFAQIFTRSQRLHSASATNLRAEEDTRRSLDALGKAVLSADFDTMQVLRGGTATFDPRTTPGPGDEVRFRRVIRWELSGPVLGAEERLFWRTSTRPQDGVASPGEVVWTHNGTTEILAPRVPGRERLVDSNGDGDWDPGENFTDTNGNGRWDPGFGVVRAGGQIRLWLTTYAAASDRTLNFSSIDAAWTLRN